jgi:hypothetical protein
MDAKPAKKGFNISKSLATKGHYIAISISNRIVAQHLSLDKNEDEIAFTIGNKKSMYNVLITDLKTGEWLVTSETIKKNVIVNETSGTIYFMSKGGSFLLQKIR